MHDGETVRPPAECQVRVQDCGLHQCGSREKATRTTYAFVDGRGGGEAAASGSVGGQAMGARGPRQASPAQQAAPHPSSSG